MKYIRTKDNIWKYDEIDKTPVRPSKQGSIFIEMILGFKKEYIEAQADTIEELCDEFVVAYEDGAKIVYGDLEWAKTKANASLEFGNNKSIIYGAIWADNGLIYVAKMNEKGELELI